MSSIELDKIVERILRRKMNSPAFRKQYLDSQPTVVHLDKKILKGVGLSDNQISQLYTFVSELTKNRKTESVWDNNSKTSIFYGNNYTSNFEAGQKITGFINNLLDRPGAVHTGHLYTASVVEAYHKAIYNTGDSDAYNEFLAAQKTYRGRVTKILRDNNAPGLGMNITTDFIKKYEPKLGLKGSELVVHLSPQTKELNSKIAQEAEAAFIEDITNRLENLKGSKTFKEIIDDAVVGKFTRGVTKGYKSKAKSKKTVGRKFKKASSPTIPRLRNKKGQFASTTSLLPVFNELISAKVKENMWESSAPNDGVLRYQTGRFANSATIESLAQTQSGALVAQYNYMRSPYDTFAPGGELHTPDRNPHRIIEKSIREIAVEILGNRLSVIPKLGN